MPQRMAKMQKMVLSMYDSGYFAVSRLANIRDPNHKNSAPPRTITRPKARTCHCGVSGRHRCRDKGEFRNFSGVRIA